MRFSSLIWCLLLIKEFDGSQDMAKLKSTELHPVLANEPDKAVDQNPSTCVTSLDSQTKAWWRVDLGVASTIRKIFISYKHDQLDQFAGFSIQVSHTKLSDPTAGPVIYHHDGLNLPASRFTIVFPQLTFGRFITIFNNRTDILIPPGYSHFAHVDLCEVQIFGCPDGAYGNTCSNPCPAVCGGRCEPDIGPCIGDAGIENVNQILILCKDPVLLQHSESLYCQADFQPEITSTVYEGHISLGTCPTEQSPLLCAGPGRDSDKLLCVNEDLCTINATVVLKDILFCSPTSVMILKVNYRCKETCRVTSNEANVPNAKLAEAGLSHATQLHYTCDGGYTAAAEDLVRDCQSGGIWTGSAPNCTRICEVDVQESGANTTILYENATTLMYECKSGFTLYEGNLTRVCMSDGSWSESPPQCNRICLVTPLEENVQNAILQHENSTQLKYICRDGFVLSNGNLSRSCINGSWNGQSPNCTNRCENDSKIYVDHAEVLINATHLNYTCMKGYILANGELLRTCLSNGSWSGHAPNCTVSTCIDELNLTHVRNPDGQNKIYKYNDKVSYDCDKGYEAMSGVFNRTCGEYGIWSPWLDPPKCKGCLCACPSNQQPVYNTTESLTSRLVELKTILTVDAQKTSKYNRSKESATDDRPTAKGIGIGVGVSILVSVFSLICFPDIPKLTKDFKYGVNIPK